MNKLFVFHSTESVQQLPDFKWLRDEEGIGIRNLSPYIA
jgi:hypothetical protein